MEVTACSATKPGSRGSNSPAPWKNASQMDCGAMPRLSCSAIASHASLLDPARTVVKSSLETSQAVLLLLPVRADSRDPCLVASPGVIRLRVPLGRIFAFVTAGHKPKNAGLARHYASRCVAACANCWPHRWPCDQYRGNRGRRSGKRFRIDLVASRCGPGPPRQRRRPLRPSCSSPR